MFLARFLKASMPRTALTLWMGRCGFCKLSKTSQSGFVLIVARRSPSRQGIRFAHTAKTNKNAHNFVRVDVPQRNQGLVNTSLTEVSLIIVDTDRKTVVSGLMLLNQATNTSMKQNRAEQNEIRLYILLDKQMQYM